MGKKAEIDPAGAMIRTSIERVLAQRGSRMPTRPFRNHEDFPAYWRQAVALYGGDDLAVVIAQEIPIGSFGRTSYAFASAATIGDAFNVFRRDSQRVVKQLATKLEITGPLAELSMRGPEPLWPGFEILLGVLALRCRQLAEPPVKIAAVSLPRAEPADATAWQKLYTVRPRFGAAYSALVVPTASLALPLRTADSTVREAIGTGPVSTMADEVRAHVRAWIRESPDAAAVARALGVSVRTLQRRLGEEGVTFRQLVLDAKIDVAKQLLAREHMTVSEIAAAVGFARVPAFSRAFSQHAGVSPSVFRSKLR